MNCCPIWQCGGRMDARERKPPVKLAKDEDMEYNGDWQSPDLICSQCGAIYQFHHFKNKGEKKWFK